MFRDAVKLTLCRPISRDELVWRKLADDCPCRWTPVVLKLPPWTCKLCHSSNRGHLGHSCRQVGTHCRHSCRQVGTHCSHDLQQEPSSCRSDPVHFKQTNIWALVGWQRTAEFFNGSCAPVRSLPVIRVSVLMSWVSGKVWRFQEAGSWRVVAGE